MEIKFSLSKVEIETSRLEFKFGFYGGYCIAKIRHRHRLVAEVKTSESYACYILCLALISLTELIAWSPTDCVDNLEQISCNDLNLFHVLAHSPHPANKQTREEAASQIITLHFYQKVKQWSRDGLNNSTLVETVRCENDVNL